MRVRAALGELGQNWTRRNVGCIRISPIRKFWTSILVRTGANRELNGGSIENGTVEPPPIRESGTLCGSSGCMIQVRIKILTLTVAGGLCEDISLSSSISFLNLLLKSKFLKIDTIPWIIMTVLQIIYVSKYKIFHYFSNMKKKTKILFLEIMEN